MSLFSYRKVNDEPAEYKIDGKVVTEEEYLDKFTHRFDEFKKVECTELPYKTESEVTCTNYRLREDDSLKKELENNTEPVMDDETEFMENDYPLEWQIIDQFMEDCFNDKTDYYSDMAGLDSGEIALSIIKKDMPKYITTFIFDDIREASQFCFDLMTGRGEYVPEFDLDDEEEKQVNEI